MFRASDQNYVPNKSKDIPSSNGLSYSAGRTIILEIPETIDFLSPSESYLKLDFKIDGDIASNLVAREDAGISSLFENVRVYSRRTGILLESVQEYGSLVSTILHSQTNEPHRSKLQATEGAFCGWLSHGNPFFEDGTGAQGEGNVTFKTSTYCLRLHGLGMFDSYENQAIPVGAFGGLRVEIDTVRNPEKGLQRLNGCSVGFNNTYGGFGNPNKFTNIKQPYVLKFTKANTLTGGAAGTVFQVGRPKDHQGSYCETASEQNYAPAQSEIGLGTGSASSINTCPLRPGETIGIYSIPKQNVTGATGDYNSSRAFVPPGGSPILYAGLTSAAADTSCFVIRSVVPTSSNTVAETGSDLGWDIAVERKNDGIARQPNWDGATGIGVNVTNYDNYLVGIDRPAASNPGSGSAIELAGHQELFADQAKAASTLVATDVNSFTGVGFTFSNISFVANEISPPAEFKQAMMERGITYRFKSYQTYKVNIPKAITSGAQPVPITNSKVYAILACPTSQDNFGTGGASQVSYGDRNILRGFSDTCDTYQYQIAGQLYPDRKVQTNPRRYAQVQSAQYLYELMRALEGCDIPSRCLKDTDEHFVMALQTGKDAFYMDFRGKDCLLYTEFSNPALDKLIKTYVCHDVSVNICPQGISVDR